MKIKKLTTKKLSLTNKGSLDLFFVGAGSAFTKKQYQTNLLIIKGNDHVLVDCGTKCNQALFELGLQITDIKNFRITHSHSDHIGGLEEAALLGRYFTKNKPTMIINETYQHILWDMSLRGGIGYNEEEAGDLLGFTDFFDVIRPDFIPDMPRETLEAKVGSINLKITRTMHIPDSSADWKSSFWSCAVIIDEKILFTSDTRYDPDLIKDFNNLYNLEAIFHDGQFFTGGVHASLDELNELPEEIKKKLYITHYGDNWENFLDKIKEYGFAGFAKQHQFYSFE